MNITRLLLRMAILLLIFLAQSMYAEPSRLDFILDETEKFFNSNRKSLEEIYMLIRNGEEIRDKNIDSKLININVGGVTTRHNRVTFFVGSEAISDNEFINVAIERYDAVEEIKTGCEENKNIYVTEQCIHKLYDNWVITYEIGSMEK